MMIKKLFVPMYPAINCTDFLKTLTFVRLLNDIWAWGTILTAFSWPFSDLGTDFYSFKALSRYFQELSSFFGQSYTWEH
jgi:hypothetical protein